MNVRIAQELSGIPEVPKSAEECAEVIHTFYWKVDIFLGSWVILVTTHWTSMWAGFICKVKWGTPRVTYDFCIFHRIFLEGPATSTTNDISENTFKYLESHVTSHQYLG